MNFALFGTETECAELSQWLCAEAQAGDIVAFDTTEGLLPALAAKFFDAVVILNDGARGMEGAIAARSLLPNIPLVWFSSDGDFAVQAYRIGVSWFGTKPLTQPKLAAALRRCGIGCAPSG